jgi:hypothetical protein
MSIKLPATILLFSIDNDVACISLKTDCYCLLAKLYIYFLAAVCFVWIRKWPDSCDLFRNCPIHASLNLNSLRAQWFRLGAWGWLDESREPWSEDASPNLNSLEGRWFRLASWRPSWWGGSEDGTNELGAWGWLWLRAKTHDLNALVEVLNLCHSINTAVTSPLLSCYVYAMLLPLWFAWTRSRSYLYFCTSRQEVIHFM